MPEEVVNSQDYGEEVRYTPEKEVYAFEATLFETVGAAAAKGGAFKVRVKADWDNKEPGGAIPVEVFGKRDDIVAFRGEVATIQDFIDGRLATLSGADNDSVEPGA